MNLNRSRYIIIVLLVFFSFNILAQQRNKPDNYLSRKNNFYQDLLSYQSKKPNKTRVDVYLQVPYKAIQFTKSDNGFSAKYTITVSIFDEDGEKLIAEKIWKERVSVKDYNNTNSTIISNFSRKSFDLLPDTYLVRTSVEDREANKNYVKKIKYIVRKLSSELSISSIMFVSSNKVVNGRRRIVTNISKNVSTQKKGVPIYFEVYSKNNINVIAEYKILDKDDDEKFEESVPLELKSGINNIFYTAKDTTINLGSYQFKITIKDQDDNDLVSTKKKFISRWLNAPTNINDLGKAIDQLVYITSEDKIDYIKEAPTKEEKIKRFKEFWKSKDPNPNTKDNAVMIEYYRRIEISDENFSYYKEGWKTDRGMVFVVLGAPDNIQDHPFDRDNRPYVDWYYYTINRVFRFVDINGFGEYRLSNPLDFDYFRYR